MATGVTEGEKIGTDTLIARALEHDELEELPQNNACVSLTYPNKLDEKSVLRSINTTFCNIAKSGEIKVIDAIEENALILSDNFYALKNLLKTHSNKVNLIYCDPPYGTGLNFQSRSLKHAYNDALGTAPWIEFMRRRLIVMRELLAEDGSIYVHIGHQMLFHLKLIMDEVFGPERFRNLIVRKKCSSKNYTKNQYPNLNDYILFYSKNGSYKWNMPGIPASEEWVNKEYTKTDNKGRYKLVPIHAPGTRNGETGKPWRGMLPPPGKHWQLPPTKLDELDALGEIHWSKTGNPRRKVYLPENKLLPLTDYWEQFRDAHHQSIMISGYPTEKNLEMMKVIISASTEPGDLVLDPFCGSGTTLHAAQELGRKWIGIDQSFTATEAALNRIRNGLKPMGDYVSKTEEQIVKISLFNKEADNFQFVVDSQALNEYRPHLLKLAQI